MGPSGGKWELFKKFLICVYFKLTLFTSYICMLIGKYTHDLDPKKRLTLPSKWRTDLGKKVVVTSGLDNSLFVFAMSEWEVVAQKLAQSSFGNHDSRSFNRFILGNAFETDVDAAGRIVIPDTLKAFANLSDKVVLAGMYSRIEIWDEKSWESNIAKVNGEADALAGKLSDLGIL
ncbi:MAG: division/cell wall cluster transcriptional repressor MraZ [Candidatus Pacebacteria bacterium]|nr:division/cell wall cluster transcriptional repressor MraZ [Candidatus Paceibacterota bacterium]MBP9866653.1 division/cell wall cluster transcriptional repressor MraZ [Candidatus Paceibacterota bacterium]